MLTDKYLNGIPKNSRMAENSSLSPDLLTDEALVKITALNAVAQRRGQTLAQMALAWALRDGRITSALIGASSVQQLEDSLGALQRLDFSGEELEEIDRYASDAGINLWARSSAE
jgi:L-glyceraldehyde 3-phosphate reductase